MQGGASPLGIFPWYDRNAAKVAENAENTEAGSIGYWTNVAYTVPAGRLLWVKCITLDLQCLVPGAGSDYVRVLANEGALLSSGEWFILSEMYNPIAKDHRSILINDPVLLLAGDILNIGWRFAAGSGTYRGNMGFTGILFDA